MSTDFYKGYLSGSVDASVIFMGIDCEILKPLLPAGVELAPQDFTPPGLHPVYWSFNLHLHNVSTPIPGLLLNYNEFAFVINCVRYRDNPELLGYPVVLYLNNWMAILGGRIFWRLNKRYASCSVDTGSPDSSFQIETRMTGAFENAGAAVLASDSENFRLVKPLLDQPLLTVGWFGYCQSSFQLDFTKAYIQPQKGEIVTQNFLPGLNSQILPFDSLQQSPMGGFYCSVPWVLKRPRRLPAR